MGRCLDQIPGGWRGGTSAEGPRSPSAMSCSGHRRYSIVLPSSISTFGPGNQSVLPRSCARRAGQRPATPRSDESRQKPTTRGCPRVAQPANYTRRDAIVPRNSSAVARARETAPIARRGHRLHGHQGLMSEDDQCIAHAILPRIRHYGSIFAHIAWANGSTVTGVPAGTSPESAGSTMNASARLIERITPEP